MKHEEGKEIYIQNKKLKKVERILFNYLIKRDKEKLANEKENVSK
jgi:hypothetical protein